MRIGIDITDLATGIVGVGTVIINMIRYYERHDTANTYFLYQNDTRDYVRATHMKKRLVGIPHYAFAKEQLYFAGRTVIDQLDIFHAPIHMPPFLHRPRTKIVITVHDVHIELDEHTHYYPVAMRNYFLAHRKDAVENAHAVIVHSQQVRNDLLRLFHIVPERIHHIPIGIKREFLLPTRY